MIPPPALQERAEWKRYAVKRPPAGEAGALVSFLKGSAVRRGKQVVG